MNRAERRAGKHPAPPKVVVGVVHPGEVSMAHMASIMRAREHMLQYGMLPGFIERRARSQHVHRARNEIVQGFLSSDCDYLLFVDADMGIPQNAIERLLAVAHVDERPIVAGLCFAQRDTGFDEDTYSTSFDVIPTVQIWNVDDDGDITSFSIVTEYPRDSVCEIGATGGACVMIHRGVLEKIQADCGDHWFTPIANKRTGGPFGEDTSFFLRCHRLGVPVHMDTSVKTSHDKGGIFLTEEVWDAQQASKFVAYDDDADDAEWDEWQGESDVMREALQELLAGHLDDRGHQIAKVRITEGPATAQRIVVDLAPPRNLTTKIAGVGAADGTDPAPVLR